MKITGTKMNLIPHGEMATCIKSVGNRDKAFKTFAHGVACSAIFHIAEHGNAALVLQLGEKLSRPSDRKALQDWALAHAPLEVTDDGNLKVKTGWKLDDFDFAGMVEKSMWEFKPERGEGNPITLDSIALYVQNKGKTAVKRGTVTQEQLECILEGIKGASELAELIELAQAA